LTHYALDRGVVLIRGIERTVEGRHVLLLNFPGLVEQACTFGDIARLKARIPHSPAALRAAQPPAVW